MDGAISLAEALRRLDTLIPRLAPELAAGLRPPVVQADLDEVAEAVAPLSLPDELIELWRWHDGQSEEDELGWLAFYSVPLLPALDALAFYKRMCELAEPESWRVSWFPIAQEGWWQAAIEMAEDGRGLIIDASNVAPNGPHAPSLAAMMHAMCEILEAGVPLDADVEADGEYVDQRAAIAGRVYEAYEWPDGPGYWSQDGYCD